jgi:hypothetical protein
VCLEAFSAYTSSQIIVFGKGLLDYRVAVNALTRQLDSLVHPALLSWFSKNNDSVQNQTIDVAHLVFLHRKDRENWMDRSLNSAAPREFGLISWAWSVTVIDGFLAPLQDLLRLLTSVIVAVIPLIVVLDLIQTTLPKMLIQFSSCVVVLFFMVLLTHIQISRLHSAHWSALSIVFAAGFHDLVKFLSVPYDVLRGNGASDISLVQTNESFNSTTGSLQRTIQWRSVQSWLTCTPGYIQVSTGVPGAPSDSDDQSEDPAASFDIHSVEKADHLHSML